MHQLIYDVGIADPGLRIGRRHNQQIPFSRVLHTIVFVLRAEFFKLLIGNSRSCQSERHVGVVNCYHHTRIILNN